MTVNTAEARGKEHNDKDTSDRARSKPSRRRRARITAVIFALLACTVLWHETILQNLAGILVVEEYGGAYREFETQNAHNADWNCVLVEESDAHGNGRHDEAARLYHEAPSRRILFIEHYPEPAVRSGAISPGHITGRRALATAGVPANAVELIPGKAKDSWQAARLLQQWLSDRPDARVLVLVHCFYSRHHRYVLDRVLDANVAARVSVRGLPGRHYSAANWWKSRAGVKSMMRGSLRLAHAWCFGESRAIPAEWNPDDYERMLHEAVDEGAL